MEAVPFAQTGKAFNDCRTASVLAGGDVRRMPPPGGNLFIVGWNLSNQGENLSLPLRQIVVIDYPTISSNRFF